MLCLTLLSAMPLAWTSSASALHEDLKHVVFGNETGPGVLQRFMMTDKGLNGMGAVCLDGTDAGFYFLPAADTKNSNDWQLYFEGGGWCYDELDCWDRSRGQLGSSADWPATVSGMEGIMSSDCGINPDLCSFNRVYMKYCDGNSFSGNRHEPLKVIGGDGKEKLLYFRGRRIVDAVLQTLLALGLGRAETVHLTGCSAGGLATYLHTDYVQSQLKELAPGLRKFKSSPISGMFLYHDTVEGKSVYQTEMQYIFALANSTHGVNERCIRSMSAIDAWKCNFAEMAYAHIQAPIFPLNSALDSWSAPCIFTSELPENFPHQAAVGNGVCGAADGWSSCAGDWTKCDSLQMAKMNGFIVDFNTMLAGVQTLRRLGNGAFIHSCYTHCEAQSNYGWTHFEVNGVTMQKAFSQWWNSKVTVPAKDNTHSHGCTYGTNPVASCNPSCSAREAQDIEIVI